jgi:hypothetical protein
LEQGSQDPDVFLGVPAGMFVGEQKILHEFVRKSQEQGLTATLNERDGAFGDYRTRG